jgi:hypothetical protein
MLTISSIDHPTAFCAQPGSSVGSTPILSPNDPGAPVVTNSAILNQASFPGPGGAMNRRCQLGGIPPAHIYCDIDVRPHSKTGVCNAAVVTG